jgi:hypothetical protein
MPHMPSSVFRQTQKNGKIVSAEEAIRVIRDGETVATGGLWGSVSPRKLPWRCKSFSHRE